ncbi:methylated-DNA--[protein]-cysteine S-methyltransferase [Kushneria aurantia]|uniref:Methylated-DNA--protein-cysteine methyltransferase n=1 Tax=Kushneria aurantia TaxID=504092 RepID=A0ABV6FZ17_9GAMM|nr:methylated-DNA--[protein]-cysteine S-methyltransferase [Kushneria aurantia]
MIRHARIDSPLGAMLLCAEGDALRGLYFHDQRFLPRMEKPIASQDDALLREAQRQLEDWFAGRRRDFDLPLAPVGSDFQQRVWQALSEIGYGQRLSYGELAQRLQLAPGAARAVGGAVGRNPLTLMVPCHRVVGGKGQLTGYAGGIERKRALLDFERGALLSLDPTTPAAPASA